MSNFYLYLVAVVKNTLKLWNYFYDSFLSLMTFSWFSIEKGNVDSRFSLRFSRLQSYQCRFLLLFCYVDLLQEDFLLNKFWSILNVFFYGPTVGVFVDEIDESKITSSRKASTEHIALTMIISRLFSHFLRLLHCFTSININRLV